MLSRVAASFYWLSRYIERSDGMLAHAEDKLCFIAGYGAGIYLGPGYPHLCRPG